MASGPKPFYLGVFAALLIAALVRGGLLYWTYLTNKQQDQALLETAQKYAAAELLSTYYKNFTLATTVAANLDFEKSFATRDAENTDKAIDALVKIKGEGSVPVSSAVFTFHDSWSLHDWRAFQSSDKVDTDKFRLDQLDIPLLDNALKFKFPPGPKNPFPCGLCALTNPDKFVLASFVPLEEKGKPIAVLSVATPFGPDLLNRIERKLKPLQTSQNKLGMALYVMQGAKITASSAELLKSKPDYLSNLTKVIADPFEERSAFTEANSRLWKNLPLWGPDGRHAMGQIIICTTLATLTLFDTPIIAMLIASAIMLILLVSSRSTPAADTI